MKSLTNEEKSMVDWAVRFGNCRTGNNCSYVRLNHQYGVKCYEYIDLRDKPYFNQVKLSKLGYAPKAFSRFKVGFYYCYLTEHVPKIFSVNCDKYSSNVIQDFLDELQSQGLHFFDDTENNFGILNNKIVIVDCE
jgi:hypothetical protein